MNRQLTMKWLRIMVAFTLLFGSLSHVGGLIAQAEDEIQHPLPSGWMETSINNGISSTSNSYVSAVGSSYNEADGSFTLAGTNGKIQSSGDSAYYVFTEASGDFTLKAQVQSFTPQGGTSNPMALLMIKNGLAKEDPSISALFNGANVLGYKRISSTGTVNASPTISAATPFYLKLERTGTTYKAYYSTDGVSFGNPYMTQNDSTGLLRTEGVHVGLAVTNAEVTFSSVTLVSGDGTVLFGPGGVNPSPTPTIAPTTQPTAAPTTVPTLAPSTAPTGTPAPAPAHEYDLTGFAYGTTGGGQLSDTDPRYKKVYTAEDFADAINRRKGYRVIEIMNDLDLGWNELSAEAKATAGSLIVAHTTPQTHPVLLQTGVSKVYMDKLQDVTIFSANGSKIKHAAWIIKYSSNIIIRNLEFDELWEWDETSKGDYDKNDWDYITIEGASTKIWVDHCTFNKAYDGVLDIKKGSNGITISWSTFRGDDRSPGSWVTQQIETLEANRSSYAMYNHLRNQGLSVEDIIAVSSSQKKGHLIGSTEFASDNPDLEVTLHHNYYKDMQDRMPRLRGGNVHAYNIVMDNADAREAGKRISSTMASAISSRGYKFGVISNGAISTESGAVLLEKSQIIDVVYPLRNNQVDPNKPQYTGKIRAVDTIYSLDGSYYRGDSDTPGNPLTPVPAPALEFSWNRFSSLPYSYMLDDPTVLQVRLLDPATGAGAGKLSWAKENWLLTQTDYTQPEPTEPPSAVNGLSASSDSTNGSISLRWSAVSGASGYTVKRSTTAGSGYEIIGSTSIPLFTDSAVMTGTTYYYVVYATNQIGDGPLSNEVEATSVIIVPPQPLDPWEELNLRLLQEDRYDEIPTGDVPSDYTVRTDGGTVQVVEVPSALDKSLFLNDQSTSTHVLVSRDFEAQKEIVVIAFDFMQPIKGNSTKLLRLLPSQSGLPAVSIETVSGNLTYRNSNDTYTTLSGYNANTWYSMVLLADLRNQTADIYLDGEKVLQQAPFYSIVSDIGRIDSFTANSGTAGHYLDRIRIYGQTATQAPNNAPVTVITSHVDGQWTNENQPTIQWDFADEDIADIQAAYHVQASSDNWDSIAWDSGEHTGSDRLYTVQSGLADGDWSLRVRTQDNKGLWSEWAYSTLRVDTLAPSTIADAPSGWVNGEVTVQLHAVDQGSGVGVTLYQINDGEVVTGDSVVLHDEGFYTITYWSTDLVGNQEEGQTTTVAIDRSGAVIHARVNPAVLWPANNKMVQVDVQLDVTDLLSGVDSVILESISVSEYPRPHHEMIQGAELGTLDTSFALLATKGKDTNGLVYTITYAATDRAGNDTRITLTVTVPHNQSRN